MKPLLNTLYLTRDGIYLSKERETLLVKREEETLMKVPIHTIQSIVCFGSVGITPPLMGFCAERGVSVVHLSEYGRFLARVEGPRTGNIRLRRKQFAQGQNPALALELAKSFVLGKITNSRRVLARALADHAPKLDQAAFEEAITHFHESRTQVLAQANLESLRGVEGALAKRYFGLFDAMIVDQKPEFTFQHRNRRPPLDRVNALLSFLYGLLLTDCRSALEAVGLDPAAGFLHLDRPGRPGLALDLMEEFRPVLADRLALSLVNRGQVGPQDFDIQASGAVWLSDVGRRKVITAYQEKKSTSITHPFLEEKMDQGLLPHAQAMLLARFLRGDLDAYPPYFWK